MSNELGIYFGPKLITLVETKAKKILHHLQLNRAVLSASELEEKVPDEIKMVALFKEELRRNGILSNEATISLCGKEVLIRTFEIPVLPANELASVINFEVKKYIPFKSEDLIADFQIKLDKSTRRNQVLYVGIKKETLDKYLSIMKQLNLKVEAIEYSGFSVLRYLKLTNSISKGVVGYINIDLREEDETDFIILENGFPLFSRDISFREESEKLPQGQQDIATNAPLEKLKGELRVSLDYYQRKFPAKKITKVFYIANEEYISDLQAFFKELALPAQFIDTMRLRAKGEAFSLGFIKGYGASLAKIIRTDLKINVLAAKAKLKPKKEEFGWQPDIESLFANFRVDPKFVIIGLFICLLAFGYGIYQKIPAHYELKSVLSLRPPVTSVNPDNSLEQLTAIDQDYKKKVEALNELITKQLYLTETLDIIPRLVPEDIRLTNLNYNRRDQDKSELVLQGSVYLGDADKELKLINSFAIMLRDNQGLKKKFKGVNIANLERRQLEKITVTNFTIECRN